MSEPYDYDLLCIGSGPAGQRAAVQAAKLGKRVALIEKRRILGGACLHTGTIPSKTLREAVISFSRSHSNGSRSIDGRPTADQLLGRVEKVVQSEVEVVEDQLWRNEVQIIPGEASFQDPHTVVVLSDEGSCTVTSSNILISVGTRPATPPGVAMDREVVITSDDVMNLKRLPSTMAVVGGGVVGIEYASIFSALGVAVTVVEQRERPLEFLDGEILDELIHQMRNRKVTFRLGEAVASLMSRKCLDI